MNDLTTLTGSGRTLSIGGEEHKVYPLTVEEFAAIQDWVDRQFPDPFAVVNAAIEKGDYTVAQQQFLLKAALERATQGRRLIGSNPEADEMVRSLEGTIELLWLSVRKGNPAFTKDEAERLRKRMTFGDVYRVMEATNADLVLADPKAEPGTTTPGGPTTTSAEPTTSGPTTGGASTIR